VGSPAVGDIVLVKFPFSDLTSTKVRPALILSTAEFDDYILCQITSSAYTSKKFVKITDNNIDGPGLHRNESFIRPDKIFTADKTLIKSTLGRLDKKSRKKVHDKLDKLFIEL
jgi:mRNA interferase MazF